MKRCSNCLTEKDLPEFYKNKSTSDGYGKWCKKCVNDNNIINHEIKHPRIICECGKKIEKVYMKDHIKRNIHHKWLRIKNQKLEIVQ
jgi:hypothetical protein